MDKQIDRWWMIDTLVIDGKDMILLIDMMMMMNIVMNRNGSYVISDEIDWEEEEEIPHRTVDVCGRTTRRIYWLPQSEVNSVFKSPPFFHPLILTLVDDDDVDD